MDELFERLVAVGRLEWATLLADCVKGRRRAGRCLDGWTERTLHSGQAIYLKSETLRHFDVLDFHFEKARWRLQRGCDGSWRMEIRCHQGVAKFITGSCS